MELTKFALLRAGLALVCVVVAFNDIKVQGFTIALGCPAGEHVNSCPAGFTELVQNLYCISTCPAGTTAANATDLFCTFPASFQRFGDPHYQFQDQASCTATNGNDGCESAPPYWRAKCPPGLVSGDGESMGMFGSLQEWMCVRDDGLCDRSGLTRNDNQCIRRVVSQCDLSGHGCRKPTVPAAACNPGLQVAAVDPSFCRSPCPDGTTEETPGTCHIQQPEVEVQSFSSVDDGGQAAIAACKAATFSGCADTTQVQNGPHSTTTTQGCATKGYRFIAFYGPGTAYSKCVFSNCTRDDNIDLPICITNYQARCSDDYEFAGNVCRRKACTQTWFPYQCSNEPAVCSDDPGSCDKAQQLLQQGQAPQCA